MMSDDNGYESAFHEGLAIVETQDETFPPRKGFIDKTGKMVVPAKFSYVYPFSGGQAAATQSERGDSGWGFIDKTGQWSITPTYKWSSGFHNGLAPASATGENECVYVNQKGDQVFRITVQGGKLDCVSSRSDFTKGLLRWFQDKRCGFVDVEGKIVIPAKFDHIEDFSEGVAAVMVGKVWGYIDTTGRYIAKPQFSTARSFHNGLARVFYDDGRTGYIDKSGKFVWGPVKARRDEQ